MQKKDFVAVIPGYTLSPQANYDDMANEIAGAIKWTKKNIATYGGNPDQIIVMGHSAGGHLAALVATNPKYLETPETYISGIVLDDAAGLDMYSYLKSNGPSSEDNYNVTWTRDEDCWKDASPIYFLNENTPPFKIYIGTKTYESIAYYNKVFLEELEKFQPEVQPTYLDLKHVPMVTQLFSPWSERYDEIADFSEKVNKSYRVIRRQKGVGEK